MDTTYLVIGGIGRTGRRITHLLTERGHDVRVTSRSHNPAFDWHDPQTWDRVLEAPTGPTSPSARTSRCRVPPRSWRS